MYKDRKDAGQKLSILLQSYRGENVIVYGLTRGGVPVALEVAKSLEAPLEAFIVKKLGAPYQEELALGAITEGEEPVIYYNREIMAQLQLHVNDLKATIRKRKEQIVELQNILRPNREILLDRNATAIIVDDGVATGATMRAAIEFFRKIGQKRIVVAVPAGQKSVLDGLRKLVDDVVCPDAVTYMEAVGEFYRDFRQVENDVVFDILQKARKPAEKLE